MEANKCSQCGQVNNNISNRIILDSCGHYKCRPCLINDLLGCSVCKNVEINSPVNLEEKFGEPTSVICSGSVAHNEVARNLLEPIPNETVKVAENKSIKCISNEVVDLSCIAHKLKMFGNGKETMIIGKTPTVKMKCKRYATLPEHIKSIGTVDKTEFECTSCGSKFKSDKQVSYHLYCNSEKPLSCPQCPKKFVKKSQLSHHLNVHAGIKKFICDTCDASFYEKHKLITHTKIHTGIKSHKCSKCEAAFYTPHALKKHAMIHLASKPYSCKTCEAKFSNTSNLKKHEAGHLNLKYFCPTCNRKCRTKYYLQKHSKICTSSFECDQCSLSFNTKKDRDRHTLIHLDFKKFKCGICEGSFRRKDGVQRHLRNTHPDADIHKSFSIVSPVKEPILPKDPIVVEGSPTITANTNLTKETQNNKSTPITTQPTKKGYVNDEDYNAVNMYKQVYVYKDHEKYIPGDGYSWNVPSVEPSDVADDSSSDCNDIRASSICTDGSHKDFTKVTNTAKSGDINNKLNTIQTSGKCGESDSIRHNTFTNEKSELIKNNYCLTIASSSAHQMDISNYKRFSVNDIIEANKSRQSVIFNIQTTENVENNSPTNLSVSSPNSNNSQIVDTVTELHDTKILGRTKHSNVEGFKSPDKSPETACIIPTINKNTNLMPCQRNIGGLQQDVPSKSIYLHKKVNYDQKPLYQQKRYSVSIGLPNKSNDSGTHCLSENKPMSKEELSELYKKILFPSYKGTKNSDKSSGSPATSYISSVESPQHHSDVFSPNSGELLHSNTSSACHGKEAAATTEHWRRRLAHSSENN